MNIERLLLVLLFATWHSAVARAQTPPVTQQDTLRDKRAEPELTAGEADGERRRRQLISFSTINLGFTTLNIGGGLLLDVAGYEQDSASVMQVQPVHSYKLRDARILLNGRFNTTRPFTWQIGVMYDKPTKNWLFRQTGIMVAVPEISSHFFLGRAKEGFSLNKVMVGYDGWSMERMPFGDATIPLLADGIKWLGSIKGNHYFWNLGYFTDWQSEGQTFSSYDQQFVARVGWVPMVSDTAGKVLHFGMNFRTGQLDKGAVQLRSRPEAFPAPYFIDTGKFAAKSANMFGPEIYFRSGNFLMGGEYYWQNIDSPETNDPSFNGGEVVLTWLTTGETRSYNTVGHYFRGISPTTTVIQGGPGAWEAVIKLSYADLQSDTLDGGKFWRITPMFNWHLTDNMRLELAYGYSILERYEMKGQTHFFQSRLQMRL